MRIINKGIKIVLLILSFKGFCWSQSLPDLQITRIFTEVFGSHCVIKVEIKNTGSGIIPFDEYRNASLRFFRSGIDASGYRLGGIDQQGVLRQPGGVLVVRVPGANGDLAPNKTVTIAAYVDYPNIGRIRESDERNNQAQVTVTCSGVTLPDLTVTDLYPLKRPDGTCSIHAKIKNKGPGIIHNDRFSPYNACETFLQKDGQTYVYYHSRIDRNQLLCSPGGSIVITFPRNIGGILSPGTQANVKVKVDSGNVIPEANENNNEIVKVIKCDPLPDLAVTGLLLTRTSRGCQISAKIKNVGGPIPNGIFDSLMISLRFGSKIKSQYLYKCDTNRALKNSGAEIICAFSLEMFKIPIGGAGVVSVSVDPNLRLYESNEANNKMMKFMICPHAVPNSSVTNRIPDKLRKPIRVPKGILH